MQREGIFVSFADGKFSVEWIKHSFSEPPSSISTTTTDTAITATLPPVCPHWRERHLRLNRIGELVVFPQS